MGQEVPSLYIYEPGASSVRTINGLGGPYFSQISINVHGRITGGASLVDGDLIAHLFISAPDGGPLTDLTPNLVSGVYRPEGINSRGEIAGMFTLVDGGLGRAFVADARSGAVHLLDLLPGADMASAFAINDKGHVVGQGTNTSTNVSRAFIANRHGRIESLTTLSLGLPDWIQLRNAVAINNRDQIVAQGTNGENYLLCLDADCTR